MDKTTPALSIGDLEKTVTPFGRMKKIQMLPMVVGGAALVGLATMRPAPQADPIRSAAAVRSEHTTRQDNSSTAPLAAAIVGPAVASSSPVARPSANLPEPSQRFMTLIAELRPKVDAALLASDFKMADRYVDEALTTPGLVPIEKQRLMVVKMGACGMRGDHAAMLTLMDEIIAVAPASPLAAELGKERPQLEKIQRLGPNHRELCLTCGQMHSPGTHAPTKKSQK